MIAPAMPTIHVPDVLGLYRVLAPEMAFFVIGEQAPDTEIRRKVHSIGSRSITC